MTASRDVAFSAVPLGAVFHPSPRVRPEGPVLAGEFHATVERDLGAAFRLGEVLGVGPGARVYEAQEARGGARVALRVLRRPPLADALLEARLDRALAAAASLDHPHVVRVTRHGSTPRLYWWSMDLVEGKPLAALLAERGRLDLRACLRIVEQAASALQYAHRRGVVHGDVRPANIFLQNAGWALVSDFGLGRVLGQLPPERAGQGQPPGYVAPEVRHGLEPGPGADQYALAATTYECLTGNHPLPSGLPDDCPELPAHVADALRRAMSPSQSARFSTVLEFVSALGAAEVGLLPSSMMTSEAPAGPGPGVLFFNRRQRSRSWPLALRFLVVLGVGGLVLERSFGREPGTWVAVPQEPAPVVTAGVPPELEAAPLPVLQPPPPVLRPPRPVPPPLAQSPPVSRPPPAVRRPPPVRQAVPAPTLGPARLYVSSSVWGRLYVDDNLVGNTPVAGLSLAPGAHRVRIVRDGFRPYEREITLAPGRELRLVDVPLERLPP